MGERASEALDVSRIEAWFEGNAGPVELPLAFEQIAGGRSNLTFAVSDAAGRRWALRRPPLGTRLASAHDMGREFRIISALAETRVPVAPALGLAEDDENPFYVMEWVEGPVLRTLADAELFPDQAERRAIAERVVDTLVAIHAVDPVAVGLGELARRSEYVARQLRRWRGQWEKQHTRELTLIDEVGDRLAARIPEQGPATIVHGDYRLDNMILTPSGEVAAVVDWELATLGDPLADVGLLLVYWGEEGDQLIPLLEPATMAPGFLTRDEVAIRYAERSGRDLSQIDFYVALALWKLAIILEGVFARFSAGQYGEADGDADADEGLQRLADSVERLARAASYAERRVA
jgi:aminoglycoside phosphotransferase (APT) family kinase protein